MITLRGRPEMVKTEHLEAARLAEEWLNRLGKGDMDGLMELWHSEGELEFPFDPNTPEKRISGFADLDAYFHQTGGYKKPRGFTIKALYPGADPQWLVVEFHGELTRTDTGLNYSNEYIAVVQVVDGKMKLFREFFDSQKRKQFEG
ncbi:nuclear transport factor 2 family protein [Roseibium sp. HPY-6]|uniref:nuclear transport factor 2 family protein n=1 Tax=Roseibium sp. HPY-6 TaxID=3229852 RepID=UPI00338F2D20